MSLYKVGEDNISLLEIAYWRKANAIHNWFVDNVQNGIDDCCQYIVQKSQLKKLFYLCKKVLDSRYEVNGENIAKELLPTLSGFCFGSTYYDDSYYEKLVSTISQLEKFVFDDIDYVILYQSAF